MSISFAWTQSLWFAQVVFALFALVSMRLTTATTDQMEAAVRDALLVALRRADVAMKTAAFAMRRGDQDTFDEAQFRRQLALEKGQHLSLYRLIRLPISVWLHFGPALMQIVLARRWQDALDEIDRLRADALAGLRRSA